MSSYNPILRFGEEKFIKACADAGVDGLIIPDLPPEEAMNLRRQARQYRYRDHFLCGTDQQG